ncbi:hypothetical protein IWQ56_002512, partial [Coemansia nantahalensis]
MSGLAAPEDDRAIPLLRSCERCRRRKQRCDGGHPICSRCQTHGADCRYRESGRFRKRFPRGNSVDRSVANADEPALSAASALSALAEAAATSPGTGSAHAAPMEIRPGRMASAVSAPVAAAAASLLPLLSTVPPPLNSLSPRDAPGSALLFSVPELSPSQGMELSPNNPLITTPMNAHSALWSPAHVGLLAGLPGNPSMIDPLRVLKAYDLPDPAKGFSEEIVLKMCDLIVGLKDGGTELCVSGSSLAVGLGRSAREDTDDELPPNLELLDPRNTAANNKSYTMANT